MTLQVTDIYSMHFSEIAGEKRRCWQRILSTHGHISTYLFRSWLQRSFHFTCQCPACQQDWETFDNLGEEVLDIFIYCTKKYLLHEKIYIETNILI